MAKLYITGLQGLADAAPAAAITAKTGTDWGALIQSTLPAVVQARHLDKVMKENLRREKAGLPPLDTENYQPGVKVGLDPQTRKLLWGGGLLTALLLALAMYAGNQRKARG